MHQNAAAHALCCATPGGVVLLRSGSTQYTHVITAGHARYAIEGCTMGGLDLSHHWLLLLWDRLEGDVAPSPTLLVCLTT